MKPNERNGPNQPRTVGILVFDEVEVLDFCGPFEVFSTARPEGESRDGSRLFEVVTIAEEDRLVRCIGGLLVQPHHTLDNHPALDILVVPGGFGTRRELGNSRLLDWIEAQNRRTELTTSVCTGAFLLAERGILNGLQATTHWSSVDWMRDRYPGIEMLNDMRVVDTGHVVTSAGISAGIDMALHVVARFHGEAAAAWTARRMEYEWEEQYRSIFESSLDAILITDPNGGIVDANDAACRLFGYVRGEMLGMRGDELVPPDCREVLRTYFRAIRDAGSAETRLGCLRKDGTTVHVEARGTAFQYQGEPRVLTMVRDITERVEAEQAVREERQRLSRELHDSVSQALFAIRIGTETTRRLLERDPRAAIESLAYIGGLAQGAMAELRALLFDLRQESLETEGLVAGLQKQAEALAARHEIATEMNLGEEPPASLEVKEALYRIAQEAMHNTFKHAEATQVYLSLDRLNGEIILEVRDNGKGFDPTGTFPGHVGLHSMEERAARLGGMLDVDSAAGSGTLVRVRVPSRPVGAC